MAVEVKNLQVSYGSRPVLRDLSFTAEEGQLLSVLGCNGVGKSTLLRCMLGMLPRYSGRITMEGADIRSLSAARLAKLAAYIPQNSTPSFHYSVEEIVLMGTTAGRAPFAVPGKQETALVLRILEELELAPLRHRCFHHLSGGERQLVILARALAQQTKILLLDEPTASLDPGNRYLVMNHLKRLAKNGYTVIQTTHDPEQTYLYADHVLAIRDGEVLMDGTPKQVLTDDIISRLYGTPMAVASLQEDRVRICMPAALP